MKKISLLLSVVILLFLIFWGGSFLKCEWLTSRHGAEFLSFPEVSASTKYKVLSYSEDSARVYCVNFNETNGTVHRYTKQNGEWKHTQWEAGGWSTSGSADDPVWPYLFDQYLSPQYGVAE